MRNPVDHRFVPAIFLSKWANTKGKLIECRAWQADRCPLAVFVICADSSQADARDG
jgi:hypothetical protein